MWWWRSRPKTTKQLGALGEEHAARYLASRGYRVRERNFRVGRGPEVDIIAEQRETLVFVEVKSRRVGEAFAPREAVTPWKQRQIIRAAATFISIRERRERVMRYDILEVYVTPEGRVAKIEHLEGAFKAR
jgi:putative endonuclease